MTEQTNPRNALPQGTKEQKADIASVIESHRDEFGKALGNIPFDYFARVAVTCIRKNPGLLICTPKSLLGCLMDLAQIRLVPDSVLGEAYLVPFRNAKLGVSEATLMIGYRGLVKLVRRNTNVKHVHAQVVYSKDEFRCSFGSRRELHHVPHTKDADRGAWLGAYAYVAYGDDSEDFVFVPADYIDRVKASSRGSDDPDSPWKMWPEMMWAKTAMRQLLKTADIHPDVAVAMNIDTAALDVESKVVTSETRDSGLLAEAQAQAADQRSLTQGEAPVNLEMPPKREPEPVRAPRARKPQEAPRQAPPSPAPDEGQPEAPAQEPVRGPGTQTSRLMTAEELAKHNEEVLAKMRKPTPAVTAPMDDGFPMS